MVRRVQYQEIYYRTCLYRIVETRIDSGVAMWRSSQFPPAVCLGKRGVLSGCAGTISIFRRGSDVGEWAREGGPLSHLRSERCEWSGLEGTVHRYFIPTVGVLARGPA